MTDGYKCDLCGDWHADRPRMKIQVEEDSPIGIGVSEWVYFDWPFSNHYADVCDDCAERVGSALEDVAELARNSPDDSAASTIVGAVHPVEDTDVE